MMSYTTTLGNS